MRVRRICAACLAAILMTAVMATAAAYVDGNYVGVGQGNNGPIEVEVVVEGQQIKAINILKHQETPMISDAAFAEIPAAIIETQSLEVDVVTGATFTSKGVILAVADALGLTIESETNAAAYVDGTYVGVGQGNNGPIEVEVVVEGQQIKAINILKHQETPMISDAAFAEIPAAIIETQSLEVDVVTGATFTSKGVILAVADALD